MENTPNNCQGGFGGGNNPPGGSRPRVIPAGAEDDPDFWSGDERPEWADDFGTNDDDEWDFVVNTTSAPLEEFDIVNIGLPAGIFIYRHPLFGSVRVWFSNQILENFPVFRIQDYTADPAIIFVSFFYSIFLHISNIIYFRYSCNSK